MYHEPTPPTLNAHGDETHPAFGLIHASRVSSSVGISLFQSDLAHRNTVRITLETATRKRDLSHDWVHGGRHLVELEMSEAQWASFVSSMNTSGVPVTIRSLPDDPNIPGIPFAPRLAESLDEVRAAARKTYDRVKAATDALEALPANAGVRARREAVRALRLAVDQAEGNLVFVQKSMDEHAENVVQKARADVEAMVFQAATHAGLEAGETPVLELPGVLDGEVVDNQGETSWINADGTGGGVRLRFIGQDGSMGLRHGQVYRVEVSTWLVGDHEEAPLVVCPVRCPYSSDAAFWRNWTRP